MTRAPKNKRQPQGGNGDSPAKTGCRCDLPDPTICPMHGMMARDGLRPLPDFPAGAVVTIDGINGGHKLRCRLLAMGLTPGTTVKIGTTSCGGCCVRVRDADLFLGQGMSEKVLARPASDATPGSGRSDTT